MLSNLSDLQIFLGTKSPRRRELFKALQIPFKVLDFEVDESFDPELEPKQIAEALSLKKAHEGFKHISPDGLLVTADTIVARDKQILNKPRSNEEAKQMLSTISGNQHSVITGVTIMTQNLKLTFHEETTVFFSTLGKEEINHYVLNYKPFDKAGAYGIQEWIGMIGVERIEGCYYNVVGLPINRLRRELSNI